jgi:hypothetical protein
MRGYVFRVMQLEAPYTNLREQEVVTPKERLTDLILSIGTLPDRSSYWDVFYVEGDAIPEQEVTLDEQYAALDGVATTVKLILMKGSLTFTDTGYTLYQQFSTGKEDDIPF